MLEDEYDLNDTEHDLKRSHLGNEIKSYFKTDSKILYDHHTFSFCFLSRYEFNIFFITDTLKVDWNYSTT